MKLYKEILVHALLEEEINIAFPNLKLSAAEIVESASYKALQKIKRLVEDESLTDYECVEQIVCVFENMGSDGGGRHEF